MYPLMITRGLCRSGIKFCTNNTVFCSFKEEFISKPEICVRTSLFKRNFMYTRTRLSKKGEKSKNDKNGTNSVPKISELRRLIKAAYPERWKIAGAVGFLVISSSVTLAVPFCMGKVIDIINTSAKDGTLMDKLTSFCSVLLVIFLIGGLANFGRVYLMQISEQRIVLKIRENLYSSIMKQEIGFFDKTKTGEIISRLSSDATMIGNSVTFNISNGLRSLAQAGGSVGMMLYVSPKLAIIALGIVPPIAVMSIIYGRYVRKITRKVQDSLAGATSVAEEKISNIRTVRSFTKEDLELATYNSSLQEVLKLAYKQALAGAVFWGSTGLSGNVIVLSVFYAGGYMMSQSMLTIGDLSAFLLYAAYVGVAMGGMTSFYSELMKGLGASTRIWELTDRTPHVPFSGGLVPAAPVLGQLEFRDVSFNYPARTEAVVLSGLCLSMPAGTVTAVVGSSGSGKSTIGSLLLRFYDPDAGAVYLDGQDIKDVDPGWLRNQIGVVSQEPALFSCSVADNIKYGASDPATVTMEMIEDAARGTKTADSLS